MKFALIALFTVAFWLPAQAQQDNRIKPGLKPGDVIPDDVPEVYPTETALREKIANFHVEELTRALNQRSKRLMWERRIALRDADYILCLFDSEGRVEPGDNPRVLLLLTTDYQLKTWGRFICEPAFAYGCVINRLQQPNTYFVTINPSGRFGGELFFEKYLIDPGGIRKLGEGYEVTKIPEKP